MKNKTKEEKVKEIMELMSMKFLLDIFKHDDKEEDLNNDEICNPFFQKF